MKNIQYVVAAESPKGFIYVGSYMEEHDGTAVTADGAKKYPSAEEATVVADKLNQFASRWTIVPVAETPNGWSQLYGV